MWQPDREYRHVVSDNLRWAGFEHRPGDIFVCTPAKNGTTWMQAIVTVLLFPDGAPGPVMEIAPWLDARFEPIDEVLARLDAQPYRRHIKTHTPADGIPHFDDASYIVVGRDGRDSYMSFLNHMRNLQPALMGELLTSAIADGITMEGGPPPVHDEHEFFAWYLDNGEQLEHIASWWPRRDDPNVAFVHYDDMKADLDGVMRGVAAFLGIAIDETRWPDQVAACTFAGMKARAEEIAPFEEHFVGGADTFLYKGTNGRWRDVLTADELARYDAVIAQRLEPDCARWLAGRTAG
ncbi:MAG: sulfotransferase domain-containing protein [Acidimicrobiia bacterium]